MVDQDPRGTFAPWGADAEWGLARTAERVMSPHMAPDARLAKLLAQISACHSAALPGARLPFFAGPHHIGYLKPDLAAQLAALTPAIALTNNEAVIAPEALPGLNALARAAGIRV